MSGEKKLFHKHYKSERKWSDRLLPRIAGILGEVFIQVSPDIEDMQHNTDLMVLNNKNHRYAVRIRSNRYRKWKDQFTIRCSVRGDVPTEFDKIMEGFGDYMFYGIANENKDDLVCYAIIDLSVFRSVVESKPLSLYENQDGTRFFVFKYSSFPEELIIKREGLAA